MTEDSDSDHVPAKTESHLFSVIYHAQPRIAIAENFRKIPDSKVTVSVDSL